MAAITIENYIELLALQSKQFLDNLTSSIEQSRKEFDAKLEKERLEREQSRKEYEAKLEKERLEREDELKKSNARMKKLEGNWGQFIESLVQPGLIDMFATRDINLRDIYSNILEYKADGQKLYEIDLFAIDGTYAVAVEVKTSLTSAYVDEHLERLQKIQEQPPHNFKLESKTILGAIAGITVKGDSNKYAQRKGLFVLTQKGNLLEMLSPAHPKEWKIA